MARERDESKRQAILAEAKRLFAEKGFHATSVNDIVQRINLPVGTIYTYFKSKEEIIETITEEGWNAFYEVLSASLDAVKSGEEKMSVIVYGFLPALLKDTDLVALFLKEVGLSKKLKEKVEDLTVLITGVIMEIARKKDLSFTMTPRQTIVALSIFLLGCLDTIRLGDTLGTQASVNDVVNFVAKMVEQSFGIKLKKTGVVVPPLAAFASG